MRTLILTLAVVVTLLMIPAIDAGSAALVAHTAEVAQMPQINVDIHDGSSPSWNPMWIAIGVIGLLLVAVLFKMSNRGGSK